MPTGRLWWLWSDGVHFEFAQTRDGVKPCREEDQSDTKGPEVAGKTAKRSKLNECLVELAPFGWISSGLWSLSIGLAERKVARHQRDALCME
jgi:hypothetical protein